jgi:hypothetical protein
MDIEFKLVNPENTSFCISSTPLSIITDNTLGHAPPYLPLIIMGSMFGIFIKRIACLFKVVPVADVI